MLGEPVDHRADLYAVSLVGYYALTGRLPFEGGTVESVLARKSAGELPRIQHFRDDVSDALFDVLKRGASRNPDERYSSAAEYAAALRAATRANMGTLRDRLRGLFGNR
jgi:serine/threonine-protein kinase